MWTMTMYNYLSKEHDVDVFVPKPHVIFNVKPYDPNKHYDLGIINHRSCLNYLRDKNIARKIFTSHGIIPGAEKPIEGADVYVGVSEEVAFVIGELGFPAQVIRNPIDVEGFNVRLDPSPTLRSVLFVSNNPPTVRPLIEQAVASLGLKLKMVGRGDQEPNIKRLMTKADIVISLGRGAYEAMALKRNVIVYDYMGADGVATPESLLEFRQNNCSGRRYGLKWTEKDLREAITQYDPLRGEKLREYIVENNNVATIAEQYLSL